MTSMVEASAEDETAAGLAPEVDTAAQLAWSEEPDAGAPVARVSRRRVAIGAAVLSAVLTVTGAVWLVLPETSVPKPSIPAPPTPSRVAAPFAPLLPTSAPPAAPTGSVADIERDVDFLAALQRAGLPVTHPANAVQSGRAICDYLVAGHTQPQAVDDLVRERGATVSNATTLVTASIDVYCPGVRR